ncbi:MAG: DUF2752 domain-containing protein [Bacillota bacterium]|nr:DUF2752 domain-containing protein [Bacillota bacterium]
MLQTSNKHLYIIKNSLNKGRRIIIPAAFIGILLLLGYQCPFEKFFGIPCPGCGMTRAMLALFHGDIKSSLSLHPLAIPLIICILIYFLGIFTKEYDLMKNKYFLVIATIIFLATYIIRMIFVFPNEAPMVFNQNAVLPTIIRIILKH